MYQIGLFSKVNQVSIKTLHYYDEIGLFKPAKIDSNTGYRYYELSQSYELHKIISLKQIGFSLDEIRDCLLNKNYEQYLLNKKDALQNQINLMEKNIVQINHYLKTSNNKINYKITIKSLPKINVACFKTKLDSYQDLFSVMPDFGDKMKKLGCICALPEYCYTVYLDGEYREKNIDVELCESIVELKDDALGLTFKTIPKVNKAACLFHKGAYKDLPNAYVAILNWMEDNNYQPDGLPRESYIDGIWNKEYEDEWLTEIHFPIKIK